jgi:Arc/MetJ family transcription regulator
MRITVDLDESLLDDLSRITGEKKKSPAVARAVAEFVRMEKRREFGRLLREGAFAEAFEPGYDPSKLDS